MILYRTFAPALLVVSLLACAVVATGAAPASGQLVGLPATSTLDAKSVIANRYGSITRPASPATATAAIPGAITQVSLDAAGTPQPAQRMVPVTFGRVFARGAGSGSDSLRGKIADG
ncbi:MAG: hypothetical protein ACJ8LG_11920, partial [Massilia sp.]